MTQLNSLGPNSIVGRHYKALAYLAVETSHNTFFHFIDTIKVRGQARNLVAGDISYYFKNKVQEKPLISGVISGFLGAAIGSLTFLTVHNQLTLMLYSNKGLMRDKKESLRMRLQAMDFKIKNLMIFAASDFCASFTKVMFEVRKMQI